MSFDIICFDCDSTLSKIEGIDELSRHVDKFDEIVVLTNAAMNGELALEEVYGKRLDLIKPDQSQIAWLADLYIAEIVDGVDAVFSTLIEQGKQVHIISGGIRQSILPLATKLGIPKNQVHAVDILFNEDGSYLGFDQQSPLAKTGGKAVICQQINNSQATMVMIGDGKTDLEAKQVGAKVIGFGGVVQRDIVVEQADVFVKETSLMAVLPHLG
ncbi:MAG: HAD-IB family phosphatase [Methylococcales symbiont of Iophon sp. n. MRB-2018]|nr:MAG: HAD-IB family phosphatase [Methylococcales symbiont of Iophon sp. n. MRB-2018]KAF3979212.1 MAG: HAD-IB family phosphatase [Methylococcales symbiont of Iophon sp. n. MRB-2018]